MNNKELGLDPHVLLPFYLTESRWWPLVWGESVTPSNKCIPPGPQLSLVSRVVVSIMASIGTALINTLSHTDTEKLFIPWWDNLEDFVIYGLITLGLVILPTQVFAGTPLFCTPCLEVRS